MLKEFLDTIEAKRNEMKRKATERLTDKSRKDAIESKRLSDKQRLLKMQAEYTGLFQDSRYVSFIDSVNTLKERFNYDLKTIIDKDTTKDKYILKAAKLSGCIELLDLFIDNNKRIIDFIDRIEK